MSTSIAATNSQALVSHGIRSSIADRLSLDPLGVVSAHLLRHLDRADRTRPGQLVAAVWMRYLTWQMRRATRALLASLDDRTLEDIGLHRSEIDTVVNEIDGRGLRRPSRA
jgi:uncharacterized protein YjiS (DUF1127 family)